VKKSILNIAIATAVLSTSVIAAEVKVLDKTHYPASNLLAYTEFELSGEPLAEALGLDLDILDPNAANIPTSFDFSAGISSYEYSEEAMYALNYQSTMGVHLVNGPLNALRGGKHTHLNARIKDMANAVGLDISEVAINMYPLSLPYVSGSPEFAQQVDTKTTLGEEFEITTAQGQDKIVTTLTPAYVHDYKTLAWDETTFDKSFNPAAIGGIFLKEVMWSQDFLGGMHTTKTDEEVEAKSKTMDQDGIHSLGVSAADGFNGMMLTEMSIDKLLFMQEQLGFDGKNLGVKFTPSYNAKKQPIWFANKVAVKQGTQNGVNSVTGLTVSNPSSQLRDTWQMLWPLAEFFAFTDQRQANTSQNPAMLAVFDGTPFASAPNKNTDTNNQNDVSANDAFSLANNISNLVFNNLNALHFNTQYGTFITEYKKSGSGFIQGDTVNTYDAAYSIVALSIYQRAKDALPVGYASADSGSVNLKTSEGKLALTMISSQADFMLNHLINDKGLVSDGVTLGNQLKLNKSHSLDTQFAAIRGLVSAFLATKDVKYKNAARKVYLNIEKTMFDKNINTWASTPGKATMHTPYTQAAISGGLREAILHLRNQEGENEPSLEVQALTDRYVSWFKIVVNGAMQLAEPIGDTGEIQVKGNASTDIDQDGVHQIIGAGGKFGTATTMANKVSIK
jgi:hypothetical protein